MVRMTSPIPAPINFDAVRADFPRASTAAYLDNASCHPLSVHVAAALHRYIDWATCDVGEPWWPAWAQARDESKRLFAALINAQPREIAFARSAVEAESNLLNGMDQIRAHARELTDRPQTELPAMGYPSITPKGNESPIVAFAVDDPVAITKKLKSAEVHVAMRFGNKMRISPSVLNNHQDIDRLLAALP